MSCILRVHGQDLDPAVLLENCELEPYEVWRKGEARAVPGKCHFDSGANFLASDSDLEEFEAQLRDATAFLKRNKTQIQALHQSQGVEEAVLDFGVEMSESAFARFSNFPAEFVKLVAECGLALELSVYACSEEDES